MSKNFHFSNEKRNTFCAGHLFARRLQSACLFSVFAFVLLSWKASATQTNEEPDFVEINAIESKVVDGFYVGLYGVNSAGVGSTNNTSPDDELIYVLWAMNGPMLCVVPAQREYAYKVELLNSNGVPMPKTAIGKRVGTEFSDFDAKFYLKGIPIKHLRANKEGHPVETPILFRPSDLFKVDKPGKYTLRIRFQILAFPKTGPGRRDFTNDLIRFPPLDYPLVQSNVPPKKL